MSAGCIHAFLAGRERDGAGRLIADILAFDDAHIEGVHDFIQWCFPLPEASRAVPGAPVLGAAEAEAIRADGEAQAGLPLPWGEGTRVSRYNQTFVLLGLLATWPRVYLAFSAIPPSPDV